MLFFLMSNDINKKMKSIIKFLLNYFWRLHQIILKKNINLKNLHKDESCVIFGNGGSLKYFDIKRHDGFFYMGTTFAMLHKDIENLKPDFYVFYLRDPSHLLRVAIPSNLPQKSFKIVEYESDKGLQAIEACICL